MLGNVQLTITQLQKEHDHHPTSPEKSCKKYQSSVLDSVSKLACLSPLFQEILILLDFFFAFNQMSAFQRDIHSSGATFVFQSAFDTSVTQNSKIVKFVWEICAFPRNDYMFRKQLCSGIFGLWVRNFCLLPMNTTIWPITSGELLGLHASPADWIYSP